CYGRGRSTCKADGAQRGRSTAFAFASNPRMLQFLHNVVPQANMKEDSLQNSPASALRTAQFALTALTRAADGRTPLPASHVTSSALGILARSYSPNARLNRLPASAITP